LAPPLRCRWCGQCTSQPACLGWPCQPPQAFHLHQSTSVSLCLRKPKIKRQTSSRSAAEMDVLEANTTLENRRDSSGNWANDHDDASSPPVPSASFNTFLSRSPPLPTPSYLLQEPLIPNSPTRYQNEGCPRHCCCYRPRCRPGELPRCPHVRCMFYSPTQHGFHTKY
jgi:hypothetical protein